MAEITSQEQFEKVKAALKAGEFADDPSIENEVLAAAEAWKASSVQPEILPTETITPSGDASGPVSGISNFQNFRAGFGKGFSDLGLAARQRASDVANLFPVSPASAAARGSRESLQTEAANRRERDAPLQGTKAGFAGELTGNVAALLPFGGLATSIPRAVGLGIGEGALRPTAEPGELATNVAIGGATGLGGDLAGRGLQRAFRPVQNSISQRGGDAVDLLRREGVNLDVAQRTGSSGAQRLRSALGDNPLTTTRQANFGEAQKRQFTRAVLKRIGANSDEATPEVLRRATDDIGRQFDDALSTAPAVWDDVFDAQIREIQQAIPGSMSAQDAAPLLRNIDDMLNSAIADGDNVIQPAVFRRIRSNLSNLRAKGNPLASDVEDIMLDALQRSGGDPAGLKTAVARYRNWKIIENSIDLGTDKTISPARLSQTFNQKRNRAVSLRHMGHPETVELSQLANAGRSILPETIGNSGTTARAIVGQGLLAAGGFGGALASGQDVGNAAAIGLGAGALPLLLQRGMLSQGALGNFLSQGANPALQASTQSPITQALIRQGAISSGLLGQ